MMSGYCEHCYALISAPARSRQAGSQEAFMTNVLIIDSAATGEASVSRKLTDAAAGPTRRRAPGARVARRDIGAEPIPHLTGETVPAIRAGLVETETGREALA